jgi:DNA repair exonuclease SbcCD ATPase subunit
MVTKKILRTYSDHREILHKKIVPTDPTELAKYLLAEKKKIDDERFLKGKINFIVEDEIQMSRVNKMKLLSDWRVIMRIAKIDEIRKELELYYQNFERELDNKDAILQMLDKDIEEAEEHYNIALTNHFIHIKQLTSLQDSRVKGLFKEFDKDVSELEYEFNTETKQIQENFEEEQNEINKMLAFIRNEYANKIAAVQSNFKFYQDELLNKINEKYRKLQDKIKKVGINECNRFSNDINDIKQKSKEKNDLDTANILKLGDLEKTIAGLKRKVDRHNEELKQWKIKIKQNNEDWESKNHSLKNEKERIMESYKILKNKLIAFRNNQREKLKRLVQNSWDCILKLKEYIKLSEKILKLAEISRRLETEKVFLFFKFLKKLGKNSSLL